MFANTVFGRLDINLQKAISEVGYKEPTPIQSEAIPHLLAQKDLIGCARTGTGKTAAFMLPILHHLVRVRKPRRIGHPRALILSPTRELAVQIAECIGKYSSHISLPYACLIGGVSQVNQVKDIKKGAETYVACPGRLIDLMTQGIVYLDQVECFVLDEADRMLDMGFMPDVKRLMSKLPRKRHTMLFSATMPKDVRELANEFLIDPVEISISPEKPTVDQIDQYAIFLSNADKNQKLIKLLRLNQAWKKVVVFTKMRHGADRVNRKLLQAGIQSAAIHSDKTQGQRTRALEGFKRGDIRVLVATDIASRGIDVPNVSSVINMTLPLDIESYVHRIGRTARAGESGIAISFVSEEEKKQLKNIERFIRKTIKVLDLTELGVRSFGARPHNTRDFIGLRGV
jgi:ATP-dependent RNA helicase RhlE